MTSPPLKSPLPDDRQTIICLYCAKPNEISRKAVTINCRHCNKLLRIEDLVIKQYQARRTIDTTGIITVEKKGHVVADLVHCGGLVIRGKLKAQIVCRGPMLVGPEAEVKGDVTAASLAVGAGATLEGQYRIGPRGEPVEPPS
jgi:hypothetical protein